MADKNVAFLTIHGMGRTCRDYDQGLRREIRRRLGTRSRRVHFGSVYYQDILQPNQDRIWRLLAGKLKWDVLREFVLFGFGDAVGLEAHKERPNSAYTRAQISTAAALFAARKALSDDKPLVILAQSLGGQVFSNYLWDAQQYRKANAANFGIWNSPQSYAQQIAGKSQLNDAELDFLSGSTLRYLYTTGCNIPIFVAAQASADIIPIDKPMPDFEWHNYYDKDDVLGWPLEELSKPYRDLVTDHRINAGQGFLGWLIKSWNPASHSEYWGDDDVLDDLETHLKSLL